jgi:hypothetical protein
MRRLILVGLLLSFAASAYSQGRPPASRSQHKKSKPGETQDTVWVNPSDTLDWNDYDVKTERRFAVYTKRPGGKDKRLRLCVNIPRDTTLYFCMVDSLCRDPEKYKVLFEAKEADSTYILLFVEAFSKPKDKPACDGGRETKLIFIRWNTVRNKQLISIKNISSCMRGIENMSKTSPIEWDGASPLVVNYYRGNSRFEELKFDPGQYKLGLQSGDDD